MRGMIQSSLRKVFFAKLNFVLPFLCGFSLCASAQSDTLVKVSGFLKDEMDFPIPISVIINVRDQKGFFGNTDGSFHISCKSNDTLSFSSFGYMTRTIKLADSIWDVAKPITIYLERRNYRLSTVQIFGQRDLQKIQEDISKLGYKKEDYVLSGIDALNSPITFLYQQFSKTEQSKRAVAEMENEDNKRELLKELFRIYIDYDIIELDDEEFDNFINFINVSDQFMKSSTQYDFILFVKERFQDYRIYIRRKQLNVKDYNYDQE